MSVERSVVRTPYTKRERVLYSALALLLLVAVAGADTFLSLSDTPDAYTTSGYAVIINASGDGLTFSSNPQSYVTTAFIDQIEKNLNVHIAGDKQNFLEAQPLNSTTSLVFSKGTGKVMIVPTAGTDTTGTISVKGTKVNRKTMEETANYTENITVTGVCSDDSYDLNPSVRVDVYTDCYITGEWFTDGVTISTTDTAFSAVNTYHLSFEQGNDKPFRILTADINYYTIHSDAEIYAIFYVVNVTNRTRVSIYPIANYTKDSHIANTYNRARGELNTTLDGTEDGYYVEFNFLPTAHKDFQNIDFKVWSEYTQ